MAQRLVTRLMTVTQLTRLSPKIKAAFAVLSEEDSQSAF
jgi:hypothetical protein